ncbi:hypothetical protein HK104_009755 [Borealophlyctis nickersoniae]|nr:hypothetical protein HK104_009755 [Borealophlyctis nickersoniae]
MDKAILEETADDAAEVARLMRVVEKQNDWEALKKEQGKLLEEVKSETLWQDDPANAIAVQKRLSDINASIKLYEEFRERHEGVRDLLVLAREEGDTALLSDVASDLRSLRAELDQYSLRLMMSDEADKCSCFIELRAGAGGVESCVWVAMVARMYEKWAANQYYSVKMVDETKGEVAGLKNATLQINGEYAYGWSKHESGIHRFVRISPFDANAKRHTSFVSVQVFPLLEEGNSTAASDIDLPPGDLKVETMRAQGAGGQHVNKTESAVRITHLPTGIVVSCQLERSQHKNRETAMWMLRSKLYEREIRAKAQAKADKHAALADMGWGSQIRSYVMQPYQMIKDVRTGYERGDVQNVLDGDLNGYMEAALAHFGRKNDQD